MFVHEPTDLPHGLLGLARAHASNHQPPFKLGDLLAQLPDLNKIQNTLEKQTCLNRVLVYLNLFQQRRTVVT